MGRDVRGRPGVVIDARPLSSTVGGLPRDDIGVGARVFHTKFGMGTVRAQDGNKLEIAFDEAGLKHVLDSFVSASGTGT